MGGHDTQRVASLNNQRQSLSEHFSPVALAIPRLISMTRQDVASPHGPRVSILAETKRNREVREEYTS